VRIAVCDDVEHDRHLLMKFIRESITSVNTTIDLDISQFSSGDDLVNQYINENKRFDIIFLDIYMPGRDGIQTAREIRRYDSICKIIFTTISSEHALDGYSVYAFNYLVKPTTLEVFKPVFLNAIRDIDVRNHKSLYIKVGTKIQSIPYMYIKYIESRGKKVFIHTLQKNTISGFYKLDDVEAMISDSRFIRSHKSHLVNMDYIKSVERYHFILKDGSLIPIRQKGYSKIKDMYYEYVIDMT
jgi:two-component system response regulator LytT